LDLNIAAIERAIEGDARAIREVANGISGALSQLMRERLAEQPECSRLDIQEILHSAFHRALQRSDLPSRARKYFVTYAVEVVRGYIIQILNQRSKESFADEASLPVATTLPPLPASRLHLDHLEAALRTLDCIDGRCRQVFEMKYFIGLSIDEIAELLELSSQTVQRDWKKARTFMYESLSEREAS
jgi:RNA polymerase sigma factor (sigma-70 family)